MEDHKILRYRSGSSIAQIKHELHVVPHYRTVDVDILFVNRMMEHEPSGMEQLPVNVESF